MYRKWAVLLLTVITLLTSCSDLQGNQIIGFKGVNKGISDVTEIRYIPGARGHYLDTAKSKTITDSKIIFDIMSMVRVGRPMKDESIIKCMGEGARFNNKLIVKRADGSIEEIIFTYDIPNEIGYIMMDGKKFETDFIFFRYIEDLSSYSNPDTNTDKQVLHLFDKYNWTIDYRINTIKERLPENLKHKAGEGPVKIYWAYNNELSKGIGYDFSEYLGKDIIVEIYRLREALPEFLEPRRNARGIILKYNDEIIGAYIDVAIYKSFACSLERKSLKDITGKEWNEWIAYHIDYEDELETRLCKMTTEEIIREYIVALENRNTKMEWACMTRKNLSQQLSDIRNNEQLFSRDEHLTAYSIESAKELEIKEVKESKNEPGTLKYQVAPDYVFKESKTSENEFWPLFVILKKESEESGWRVDSIGNGPQ